MLSPCGCFFVYVYCIPINRNFLISFFDVINYLNQNIDIDMEIKS